MNIRWIVLLALVITAGVVWAEDVHDFSNLDAVKVPEGTAAAPGLLLSNEGEVEGEQEGLYRSVGDGGDELGVSINSLSVGIFRSDGLYVDSHGTHTGDVDGADITGDSYETTEGEGYIWLRDGAAADPVLYSDAEGEREGWYPLAEGEDGWGFAVDEVEVLTIESDGVHGDLTGDSSGTHTGDVDGGDITADTITMNEGEGEGLIQGYLQGNVQGNLTGNSAGTHTGKVSLPDGTEGEPSDYYTNDTNTGRYRIGADEMGWVTGGTLRLRLSTTALTSTVPFVAPLGSVSAAGWAFVGDLDTGLYSSGSGNVSITSNGTQMVGLNTAVFQVNTRLLSNYFPGGTTSQFAVDTNLGGFGLFVDGTYAAPTTLNLMRKGAAAISWDDYTQTRMRTGGAFALTDTNYYEGAAHNALTLRAARGTSASPDYLDASDIVGTLKFEARDGAGTWGDVGEIRAIAVGNHASGDTHGGIHVYATKDGSDTQTKVAGFESYIYAPGVLDLVLPRVDMRMATFWDYGSDCGFGYFEDVLAALSITIPDGVSVFDTANAAPVRLHFGNDDTIYFGNGASSVGVVNSYKMGVVSDTFAVFRHDGSSYDALFGHNGTTLTVYEGGVTVTSGDLTLSDGDVVTSADDAFYLGDPSTDGTWRIIRDGNNLVHQRRESGSWVAKQTITP